MSDLPKWVWDLVADLEDEEDIHPTLYREGLGADTYTRWDWCPEKALQRVSAEVRAQARVIAAYRRPEPEPIRAATTPTTEES